MQYPLLTLTISTNKTFSSSYAEARSSLFFGLDRPGVIASFFRGKRIRTIRPNETSALNMIQILEGVSRRAISVLTCVEVTRRLENWRDYAPEGGTIRRPS